MDAVSVEKGVFTGTADTELTEHLSSSITVPPIVPLVATIVAFAADNAVAEELVTT